METMILSAPAALWAGPMFDSGLFKHILDTINAGKVLSFMIQTIPVINMLHPGFR